MHKSDISVVIISWNNDAYLLRCLRALILQTTRNFETIVVDNGSNDSSNGRLETISELKYQVKYLKTHVGFAAANNIGAHLADRKSVV